MKLSIKIMAILILALPFSVPAAPDDEHYGEADLDQMLAPIALYPDSVLSQVLIAATYPLEVAQAARWSRQHSRLKGEDAVDAVEDKDWDISVKSLVAFPEILDRMDEDLDWTQRLGEAFLAQEGEVMDRVQLLRQRAHDAGNLDSNEQVRVVREREIIYIEPAYRHRIFVPYYDPWVIYGHWWWPAYPPYCWSTWGGHSARYYNSYSPSYYWGVGFNVSPVFYFSGFHWRDRHVVVFSSNRHRHTNWNYSAREFHRQSGTQRWQHDTRHRRGVDYRSERLSQDHGRMRRDAVQREQQLSRQPSSTNRRESQRDGAQQQRDQRDNPKRSNRSSRHEPAREEPQQNGQRRDAGRRENEPRQERRSRAERGAQAENPGRGNQAEERERSPHYGNNRGDESQSGGSRRQPQSSRRPEPTRSEPESREEPQRNSERQAADRRANEPRQERRSGAERGEPSENSAREYRTGERERNPQSGNNRGDERQKGGSRHRSER